MGQIAYEAYRWLNGRLSTVICCNSDYSNSRGWSTWWYLKWCDKLLGLTPMEHPWFVTPWFDKFRVVDLSAVKVQVWRLECRSHSSAHRLFLMNSTLSPKSPLRQLHGQSSAPCILPRNRSVSWNSWILLSHTPYSQWSCANPNNIIIGIL